MFKKALWSRSLVWCSECLLKDSLFPFPFLHSLYIWRQPSQMSPLSPATIPFLFLFGKDPGVLCLYKHLLCQALTDRQTFFESGLWGAAFLTPVEWIMQKKSTHFTAGCWPKLQDLCSRVVVLVKIDRMKWGEQQGRKQNLDKAGLIFFMALCLPVCLPLGKFHGPWGVTGRDKNKTKKWCLWGCKTDLFLKNLGL